MIASASVAVLAASGLRIGSAHVELSCPDGSGCTYHNGEEGFWAEDATEYDLGHEGEPIWVTNKSSGGIVKDFGDGNYKIEMDFDQQGKVIFAQQGENPYTNKYTGESTTFVMEIII